MPFSNSNWETMQYKRLAQPRAWWFLNDDHVNKLTNPPYAEGRKLWFRSSESSSHQLKALRLVIYPQNQMLFNLKNQLIMFPHHRRLNSALAPFTSPMHFPLPITTMFTVESEQPELVCEFIHFRFRLISTQNIKFHIQTDGFSWPVMLIQHSALQIFLFLHILKGE